MKYVYKTKRLSKTKFKLDCENGFVTKPNIKGLGVVSITLYDNDFISYYIEKAYLNKLKKLLEQYANLTDEDDEDAFVNQLDALEFLILNEYKSFLSIDVIKNMLKDIYTLKQKVFSKNIVYGKQR